MGKQLEVEIDRSQVIVGCNCRAVVKQPWQSGPAKERIVAVAQVGSRSHELREESVRGRSTLPEPPGHHGAGGEERQGKASHDPRHGPDDNGNAPPKDAPFRPHPVAITAQSYA
jgi:hypothetical protein